VHPDAKYAARLSALAEREPASNWQLVGSMTLLGDLESAKAALPAVPHVSGPHIRLQVNRVCLCH
jgi:hypothetical protein